MRSRRQGLCRNDPAHGAAYARDLCSRCYTRARRTKGFESVLVACASPGCPRRTQSNISPFCNVCRGVGARRPEDLRVGMLVMILGGHPSPKLRLAYARVVRVEDNGSCATVALTGETMGRPLVDSKGALVRVPAKWLADVEE